MDEKKIGPDGPSLGETADRLHSAAIHLLRHLRQQDLHSGLTASRLSALSVVVFGGPLTLKALAAAEQVRPPTMSRIVDALEQAHLVIREPNPKDQRNVMISATPTGKTVLEQGRARRTEQLAGQLAGLPANELVVVQQAAEILDRLSRAMRMDPDGEP